MNARTRHVLKMSDIRFRATLKEWDNWFYPGYRNTMRTSNNMRRRYGKDFLSLLKGELNEIHRKNAEF